MAKYFSIQIPEPCHEQWDNMKPENTGRHCDSCNKTVIDFTAMTDSQLSSYFAKPVKNICGRFCLDQVGRDFPVPHKQTPWLKYFFTITIPAFLVSLKASGQNTSQSSEITEVSKSIIKEKFITSFISGSVTDEKGEPVEGASVSLSRFAGTVSDVNGAFRLLTCNADSIAVISAIGYKTEKVRVTAGPIQVCLKRSEGVNLTTVIVTAGMVIRIPKKKIRSSIKEKAIPERVVNDISIYPNPAISNSVLNVSWKNSIMANQIIEIFSSQGTLIQKENFTPVSKMKNTFVLLKNLPKGLYIIRCTDGKSMEKLSKEFIVE